MPWSLRQFPSFFSHLGTGLEAVADGAGLSDMAAMELAHQGLTDFAGGKVDVREGLIGRKAGRFHVVGN